MTAIDIARSSFMDHLIQIGLWFDRERVAGKMWDVHADGGPDILLPFFIGKSGQAIDQIEGNVAKIFFRKLRQMLWPAWRHVRGSSIAGPRQKNFEPRC